MRTSIVTVAIAIALTAFAAPAAAECTDLATGGVACATLAEDGTPSWVYANQPGVAFATYDASEYTFWGTTYSGKNLYVSTAHDGPAAGNSAYVNQFCMDVGSDGSCDYEDTTAGVYASDVTNGYVAVYKSGEYVELCTGGSHVPSQCTPLLG